MFSFQNFIKRGFLSAIGKLADYQIILNAAGWHEKGVLTETDLAEIQAAIDARNDALSLASSGDDTSGADANSPVV